MRARRAVAVAVAAGTLAIAARPGAAEEPRYETLVEVEDEDEADAAPPQERPRSEVTRADLERRLPRSAPDAVRWEPGVFVQQSAHGQGSPFIRGMTGQQTLILFDGIRLNNSVYRQGPNQYFFTLDPRTIDSIEVLRGGASTRYGSDALGGVLSAHPVEPRLEPGAHRLLPSAQARLTTADDEGGGRLQLDAGVRAGAGFVGGIGGRTVGRLESGGVVRAPADGSVPAVPRFEPDGRTQLGTGYEEVTGDGRLVVRLSPRHRLTAAAYAYRQFDSPRTDQCPPPYARSDECLTIEEQFRTLVYGRWDGRPGRGLAAARVTLSWQDQHERRDGARPASYVDNVGRDDVATLGASASLRTRWTRAARWLAVRLVAGADTYHDRVRSRAWQTFTDVAITRALGRGQYLDGSTYTSGGAFVDGEARLPRGLAVVGGGRASWVLARAPADPESGSGALARSWFPVVGHVGASLRARPWLTVLANLDRSFRAPNLDDMTSRQQTGPGFQIENPELGPEAATSVEAGARLRRGAVAADLWAFHTWLDGAVGKVQREIADCPPETPACASSWSRVQLVNAREPAILRGVEAAARLRLPRRVAARATIAWTWGDGPNLMDPPSDPAIPHAERVPLTRIPPLNGTVEATWANRAGFSLGGGVRWAARQDRLALADLSDARIPPGGTPGYAVLDVRGALRLGTQVVVALALENVLDAAYRTHGSSVNGPGRGLILWLEARPF